MTLTTEDRARLAARSRDQATMDHPTLHDIMLAITPDDLRPYRDDLIRFTATPRNPATRRHHATWVDVDSQLLGPRAHIATFDLGIPNFFRWLEDQQAAAVPSGDTVDERRTIEYWNSLTRTSQWEPYLDDLIAYIPQSTFNGWDHNTVRCILGLPYTATMTREEAQAGFWMNDTVDAAPGTTRHHAYLGEFARAVVDGTYTLTTAPPVTTTTSTTEEPPVTALLTPDLLDTPVHQWPRDVREAASDEIARFFYVRGINDTPERAKSNSDYALLFEDHGPGNSTWRDAEFHIHRRFREEVRAGTFTTPLTAATPVPSGDTTTNLEVAAFIAAFRDLPNNDPTRSLGAGYADDTYETRCASVQAAFLAMPEARRDTWQALYEEAERHPGAVNLAGVQWAGARVNSYGHSTENFFRWAKRINVTTTDGTPTIPAGVLDTTTPEPPITEHFDPITTDVDTFHANRYTYANQLDRATFDQYVRQSSTDSGFLTFNFIDRTHDQARWESIGENTRRNYSRLFLDWLRANIATLRWATPTAPAAPTPTVETGGTVIPIGPGHPGWNAFAERLAEIATANSMCPEYDRIARNVGLPTRKERVTYRIVLDVPVDVERGNNADVRTLRTAAAEVLQRVTGDGARRLEASRTQVVG